MKSRAGQGKVGWTFLAAFLALLAVGWLVVHLQPSREGRQLKQMMPRAAARRGDRMLSPLPQGEVAINTATLQELCALPGIGPSIAQAILEQRQENGPFFYPEDLLSVKGLGTKKLEGLWQHLSMEAP